MFSEMHASAGDFPGSEYLCKAWASLCVPRQGTGEKPVHWTLLETRAGKGSEVRRGHDLAGVLSPLQ